SGADPRLLQKSAGSLSRSLNLAAVLQVQGSGGLHGMGASVARAKRRPLLYVSHRSPGIQVTSRRLGPVALAGAILALAACDNTNGPPSSQPYVLFAPLQSNVTYLMDLQYQAVHQWRADSTPSCSVYLLEDGRLLRPRSLGEGSFPNGGGNGGRVELLDWGGKGSWGFDYFAADHQPHHALRWLPHGHLPPVPLGPRTAAEALAAGRSPETIPANGVIWVDHVVEVDPSSNAIVWVWRAWDHLLPPGADPRAHPELVDPNAWATTSNDWTHTNAIDYNAQLDQIVLSVRNHHEIWVIDHGTTTAEAAGHTGGKRGRGGDLLYRWGTPADYGFDGPQQLFGQHNARWIEAGLPGAGHLLIFDNGDRTTRRFSTVVEIDPPL